MGPTVVECFRHVAIAEVSEGPERAPQRFVLLVAPFFIPSGGTFCQTLQLYAKKNSQLIKFNKKNRFNRIFGSCKYIYFCF